MSEHITDYATVTVRDGSVTVAATHEQLYAWAHRTGNSWPCSSLARLDEVAAWFNSSGLVDLFSIRNGEEDEGDIPSDELNAWSSDALRDVLPTTHPVYFIAVGQFDET